MKQSCLTMLLESYLGGFTKCLINNFLHFCQSGAYVHCKGDVIK